MKLATCLIILGFLLLLSEGGSQISSDTVHNALDTLLPGLLQSQRFGTYGKIRGTTKDVYTSLVQGQFKAYRPGICQQLRENAGVSEDLYQQHLQASCLDCLTSTDSKSKQFFWRSTHPSNLLVIKTIKNYECKNLRKVLNLFLSHVYDSDQTCIGNVLGLYRVKIYRKSRFPLFRKEKTYYFLVCKNVYSHPGLITGPTVHRSIKYDLKGSTVGRKKSASSTVYKDLDLIANNKPLSLGHHAKEVLMKTLVKDVHFLSQFKFMDYSLLVEIEELRFNNIRRFCHKIVSPVSQARWDRGKLVLLGEDGNIYNFGMIDFLQKYTLRKWFETLLKGFFWKKSKISCVDSKLYAKRMVTFIDQYTV